MMTTEIYLIHRLKELCLTNLICNTIIKIRVKGIHILKNFYKDMCFVLAGL